MKLTEEQIKQIEFALSFIDKKVYASKHNYEGKLLPSIVNRVILNDSGDRLIISLDTEGNDKQYYLYMDFLNITWFLKQKDLKEYWEKHKESVYLTGEVV